MSLATTQAAYQTSPLPTAPSRSASISTSASSRASIMEQSSFPSASASTPRRLPVPSSSPSSFSPHQAASASISIPSTSTTTSPMQANEEQTMRAMPPSPPSSHSSPYVSPRLHHRGVSDPASGPIDFPAPPMRRGAVSGASGPLSFPPLSSLFRHASAGPGGDGPGPTGGSSYLAHGQESLYHQSWSSSNGSAPACSGRMGSISAASGPHFPLPSSYSLSSGAGSPIVGPTTVGAAVMPSSSSSSSGSSSTGPSSSAAAGLNSQRRGGLSASSGVGVYGAATQAGNSYSPQSHHQSPYTLQPIQQHDQRHMHTSSSPYPMANIYNQVPNGMHSHLHAHHGHYQPYWSPMTGNGAVSGAGYKRKQTSLNPPPRNYGCPNCPASFSRRHDLNRHSRIHLAVKPFGCPNCSKTFSRKDALKRHLMVKGCGKDAEGKPRKRRGRKSAAEKLALQQQAQQQQPSSSAAVSSGVVGSQQEAYLPSSYNPTGQDGMFSQTYGSTAVDENGSMEEDDEEEEDEEEEEEMSEGEGDEGDDQENE